MLNEYERDIGHYKTKFVGTPKELSIISFDDLIEKIMPSFQRDECFWLHENETASVRLIDIAEDFEGQYFVMLISASNTRLSDPSFEHITNGEFRTEEKQEGEGIAYSAHLIIDKLSISPAGYYSMCLEKITGLGSSVISPFLNAIFKTAYESFQPIPTFEFNGSERQYRPLVEIVGDLSENLAAQLSRGRLTGVELIDHRNGSTRLDEYGVFEEKKYVVELSVAGDPDEQAVAKAINALSRRIRGEGFDELKVRLQHEDIGQQTVPIKLDIDQEATETLAIRKDVVSVSNRLGQRHATINEELVNAIIGKMS